MGNGNSGPSKEEVRAEVDRSNEIALCKQENQLLLSEQRSNQKLEYIATAANWAIQSQTRELQASSMQVNRTVEREAQSVRDTVTGFGRSVQAQGQQIYNAIAGFTPVIQQQTVAVRDAVAELGRSIGVESKNLQTGLQTTLNVAVGLRDQLYHLRIAAAFIMALCGYLVYRFWKTDAERESSNLAQAELVKNLTSAAIKSDLGEQFDTFSSTIYIILAMIVVIQVFTLGLLVTIWRSSYGKSDISANVAAALVEVKKQDSNATGSRGQSSSNGASGSMSGQRWRN